jgi:hypothetical protein
VERASAAVVRRGGRRRVAELEQVEVGHPDFVEPGTEQEPVEAPTPAGVALEALGQFDDPVAHEAHVVDQQTALHRGPVGDVAQAHARLAAGQLGEVEDRADPRRGRGRGR